MFARSVSLLGVAWLVSACAMTASPPPTEPAPPPPRVDGRDDSCGAERVQDRVGRTYTESLGQSLQRESGAGALRVMRPGHAYTLEYRDDRLNIRVDEAGVITAIGCG